MDSICLRAMHSSVYLCAFVKCIDALPTTTTRTATTKICVVLKLRKNALKILIAIIT